jgi:hypothetical protein
MLDKEVFVKKLNSVYERQKNRKDEANVLIEFCKTKKDVQFVWLWREGKTLQEIGEIMGGISRQAVDIRRHLILKRRELLKKTYPALRMGMLRKHLKAVDLAIAANCTVASIYRKLKGDGDWKLSEMSSIRDRYFPETSIDKLFLR